ncbi:hypothetical protein [Legionella shakespearei]|uniref:Substrate of the Dot/Icm secretion system n=1 Tax=Legionella shakespearei DSM 23087 TaxID=1122169 RepID=A0A0W0YLK0_9GAMM|nr:hypothetical protein [Legionella shakespearei]KTD57588.1 substrate of the Dot/Icm secretion system [Legionella shakespearei DSM 23087]
MALSEIIINDAVQYQTDATISEANYQALRQYLLERKPLSPVTTAIYSLVSSHCASDKQEFMHHSTLQACEAQKSSDEHEEQNDQWEQKKDTTLHSQYTAELQELQSTLSQLEIRRAPQQRIAKQSRSQVEELRNSLRSLDASIDRIQSERLLLNYQSIPSYPVNNVHVHGHYSTTIGYPNAYTTPYYDYGYSLQTELRWSSLFQEENRLKDERRRLNLLINTKERECSVEEKSLDNIILDQSQAERRYKELKQQLHTVLPNREEQRQIRSQGRMDREQARNAADPDLRQLSSSNKEQLRYRITRKNSELDDTQNKLMRTATELSYTLYLSQLEQALERTDGLKITFTERQALKSILATMHSYNEMEGRAKTTQKALNDAKAELQRLQSNLLEKQQQVQHYAASRPQLVSVNQDLEKVNNQHFIERDSAESARTTALFFSLFGVSACSVSAGLVSSLMVSPLFFIIPGVFALGTLISLTVAVIYHFQKSGYEGQIDENKQTILNNQATLEEQGKKAENINTSAIPALQTQIKAAEQNCAQIEKDLKEQQRSMSQLLGRAQNITSTYGGSGAFFNSSANASLYPVLEQPSAPEYDVDLLLNYGGQQRA